MDDVNPFADPETTNPFGDPSVQQATGRGQQNLNDYNPFEESNKVPAQPTPQQQVRLPPPPRPNEPSQPAVMQPTEAPPAYTSSAAQPAINTDDLQRRQEELERKAAELQRKEQEMRAAEYRERKDNFPPLPKFCCVGPCFYQDFAVDIPLEFQRTVKLCYYYWIFYSITMLFNLIGALAFFIAAQDPAATVDGGATFGLAFLWFLLFTPCSFLCWYRPVYKAFRSDSSVNFFTFFFVMFFQFICNVVQCIGISGYTVGWINAFTLSKYNLGVGILMMVIASLFTLCAVGSILLLIKVHRLYRSTGASFQKAQQEFATGVMKNDAVQNAAGAAAQGAVRNMAAGNRY